ncbi:MAG: putative toxin-antitoxin system toxin component, PIN family [Desulfobacterales bacterium]
MKKEKPVRAVIDTNLFISGLFADKGYSSQLQDLWVSGAFELAVSEKILKELKTPCSNRIFTKNFSFEDGEEASIINLIREKATVVTADHYQTDKIKTDPSDNKFLACALEVKADYIVSGDNRLLELKHFYGIQIIDAKTFIGKVAAE